MITLPIYNRPLSVFLWATRRVTVDGLPQVRRESRQEQLIIAVYPHLRLGTQQLTLLWVFLYQPTGPIRDQGILAQVRQWQGTCHREYGVRQNMGSDVVFLPVTVGFLGRPVSRLSGLPASASRGVLNVSYPSSRPRWERRRMRCTASTGYSIARYSLQSPIPSPASRHRLSA